MDNVQNCDSYINIPSSQTYATYIRKLGLLTENRSVCFSGAVYIWVSLWLGAYIAVAFRITFHTLRKSVREAMRYSIMCLYRWGNSLHSFGISLRAHFSKASATGDDVFASYWLTDRPSTPHASFHC
jgi:hypothetical protein